MPTTNVSIADLLNQGLSHPALTQTLALAPNVVPDDTKLVAAFRKAGTQVVVSPKLEALLGSLITVQTPLDLATRFIEAKYQALGGPTGFLGKATTAVTVCPDGKGYYRHHAGGSIYWHYATGAHEVHGLIRQKWANLGWERSFLGYPTTDETPGRELEGKGRFNRFQGGGIWWHPATGAFEVHGAILQKYLELGAEGSLLGYPTTDETGTPDGVGRFNHFQLGSIYWTPYTGAHEVHGLIRQLWAERGWERNPAVGYPTTDELIPDRHMGFARPLVIRRPGLSLPADVFRLPAEATTPGLVVKPTTPTPGPRGMGAAAMNLTAGGNQALVSAATLTPAPVAVAVNPTPAAATLPTAVMLGSVSSVVLGNLLQAGISQGAKENAPSRNRFSDFENAVLFWQRDASAATILQPWRQTAKGEKLGLSAAEVAGLASTPIRSALSRIPGVAVAAVNFSGATRYSHDGAGVHNRRHKLLTILQGVQMIGATPMPVSALVEIHCEISFDPINWRLVGQLVEWRLLSASGLFLGAPIERQLHGLLDPILWTTFPAQTIPSQDGAPLPVLSVKVMPDGEVCVYIEP